MCTPRVRVRVRVRVRGETNCPLGRDVVSLGRDVQAARFLLSCAIRLYSVNGQNRLNRQGQRSKRSQKDDQRSDPTADYSAPNLLGGVTQGRSAYFLTYRLTVGVGPRMSKTKMSNARMSNISVHVPRMSNALTN